MKRVVSLILCVMLVIGSITVAAAPSFADTGTSPYADAIKTWVDHGVIFGRDDATFDPNGIINRAEMAAILGRTFGYKETTANTFGDLSPNAWYYDDMLRAVKAGVYVGSGDGNINPEASITRAEAVIMFARAFMVSESYSEAYPGEYIPDWGVSIVNGMYHAGYLDGLFADGFNYATPMTRAETTQLLQNCTPNYFNVPGTYNDIDSGNVVIATDGVTLKGITVSGNVIISEGVEQGGVTLNNVKVSGTIAVKGGSAEGVQLTGTTTAASLKDQRPGGGAALPTPKPSATPRPTPTPTPTPTYFTVSGKVVNSAGTGIKAKIQLRTSLGQGVSTVLDTNNDGSFTITNVQAQNNVLVTATATNYNESSSNTFSVSSDVSNVNITLTANTFTVSGYVYDDQIGSAYVLSGMSISLYTSAGSLVNSTTTTSNGGYSFTNVPTGSYYIGVNSSSAYYNSSYIYGVGNATGTFSVSSDTTQNVVLKRITGNITVTVYNNYNNGTNYTSVVPNTTVYISGTNISSSNNYMSTDSNGQVVFRNLPYGTYTVSLYNANSGITYQTANVTLSSSSPNGTATLYTNYNTGYNTVTAYVVTGTANTAVAGATVTITNQSGTSSFTQTATYSTSGYYYFTNVPNGTYSVSIVALPSGYTLSSPSPQTVVVSGNSSSAVTFTCTTP